MPFDPQGFSQTLWNNPQISNDVKMNLQSLIEGLAGVAPGTPQYWQGVNAIDNVIYNGGLPINDQEKNALAAFAPHQVGGQDITADAASAGDWTGNYKPAQPTLSPKPMIPNQVQQAPQPYQQAIQGAMDAYKGPQISLMDRLNEIKGRPNQLMSPSGPPIEGVVPVSQGTWEDPNYNRAPGAAPENGFAGPAQGYMPPANGIGLPPQLPRGLQYPQNPNIVPEVQQPTPMQPPVVQKPAVKKSFWDQ